MIGGNYVGINTGNYDFKKFEVVEEEGVKVEWFAKPFMGNRDGSKGNENEKIWEEEVEILAKDIQEEKKRNNFINNLWDFKGKYLGISRKTIEEFEDAIGVLKSKNNQISKKVVENSELKEKGSKIVEIIKETIDYCTKELERYKNTFPGGKKILINIEFLNEYNIQNQPFTFQIQNGLSDKELNPDGKKLIDFRWQFFREEASGKEVVNNSSNKLELTFGHIGSWISRAVLSKDNRGDVYGHDMNFLKMPISDVKDRIAIIEPQVKKTLVASAKKRK